MSTRLSRIALNGCQYLSNLPVGGFCLLLLWLLASGCGSLPTPDLVIGPGYYPSNVYGQNNTLPADFRRIALLPSSGCALAEAQETISSVLASELAKTKRFELVPISPEQLATWTGQKAWPATVALPVELAARLRQELGCDGVLVSELTQYRAYPPLVVGWNLKLVDFRSGQIVWAADEVFDGGQTAVANSARRYRLRHSQVPCSLEDSRFVLLSPTAFGHYAADALFATLPALPTPQHSAKVLPAPADKDKRIPKSHRMPLDAKG